MTTIEPNTETNSDRFSTFKSISLIYGNIVGVGIFTAISPSFNIFTSNNIIVVIIFWILGYAFSLLGALCYAELVSRFPESGGESVYYNKCLYEKFSVCFILMFLFFIQPLTLAVISKTASKYFIDSIVYSNKDTEYIQIILAVFLLILCFVANCISQNHFAKINIIFSASKFFLLIFIIIIGFTFMNKGNKEYWKLPLSEDFSILNFCNAVLNILWAFDGWNCLGFIAGKGSNKNINFPWSIFIGVSSVAIMYIITILGYYIVMGCDNIRINDDVIIVFSQITLHKWHGVISSWIMISAIGSINSLFYMTSVAVVTASNNGQLPKMFSHFNKIYKTPIVSLFVILLCALLFMCFDFKRLLTCRAFITWVFYFISFKCLRNAKLQNISSKKEYDGYSINYSFIIIIQSASLSILIMCLILDWHGCLVTLAILAAIFFVQFITQINIIKTDLNKLDDYIVAFIQKYADSEESDTDNNE